jgi:hypothetical protein
MKGIIMVGGKWTCLMPLRSNQPEPGSGYLNQLRLSSSTFVKLLRTRLPRPSSEQRW